MQNFLCCYIHHITKSDDTTKNIELKIYLARLLQLRIGIGPKEIVEMIENSCFDELSYLHQGQYARIS